MPTPQQHLNSLVPRWKQLYHKFKSIRTVPFRKRFFIGYDLAGNTYWEFKLEQSHFGKLRRILTPGKRQEFIVDYYKTVPPMWHQWLRFTRDVPPSLQELMDDEERLRVLKINSKIIEENRKNEKLYQDEVHTFELDQELDALEKEKLEKLQKEKEFWDSKKQQLDDGSEIKASNVKPRPK